MDRPQIIAEALQRVKVVTHQRQVGVIQAQEIQKIKAAF